MPGVKLHADDVIVLFLSDRILPDWSTLNQIRPGKNWTEILAEEIDCETRIKSVRAVSTSIVGEMSASDIMSRDFSVSRNVEPLDYVKTPHCKERLWAQKFL